MEYSNSRILIWDDQKQKVITKIKCKHAISNISYSNGVCMIPHDKFVSCVSIDDKFIYKIDTFNNPKGLHAVSCGNKYKPSSTGISRLEGDNLLWYCVTAPYINKGSVIVQWFEYN
jgi:hypothetical protein